MIITIRKVFILIISNKLTMGKKDMYYRLVHNMKVHLILIIVLLILLLGNVLYYSGVGRKTMCYDLYQQREDCIDRYSPYSPECEDIFFETGECIEKSHYYKDYSQIFSFIIIILFIAWIVTFVLRMIKIKHRIF